MKKTSLLLGVSILGNLALLALVLLAPVGKKEGSPAAATSRASATAGQSGGKTGDVNVSDVDPALWKNLGGEDLPSLVSRLRGAGFPPSIVRAIVAAQVNESFAARRKAIAPPKTDVPFWKIDQPTDPKTLAALRDLGREQSKVMKDLLGTTLTLDDPLYAASLRRQYGNLPQEKIDQITRVKQDYQELQQQIYTAAGLGNGGVISFLPEERAKLALLEKEQRADIAQLLTPQELEDYELRSGSTANQMRYSLSAFKPTEEEFRAIYKLQRPFDEQYNTQNLMAAAGTPATQDLMRQRMDAQKQLLADVKAALGPERGAEYERAIDGNFQQINRVVERLDLPQTAAVEVWSVQKDIEQRMNAWRNDRTLPPPARAEQLSALAQEAEAKVTAALGPRGFEVYKQYGGSWIRNLQAQANARPVPPTGNAPVQSGGAGGGGARSEIILR